VLLNAWVGCITATAYSRGLRYPEFGEDDATVSCLRFTQPLDSHCCVERRLACLLRCKLAAQVGFHRIVRGKADGNGQGLDGLH